MTRARQRGNLLWVSLGVILVVAIGGLGLATMTQGATRQTALVKSEVELKWVAEAVLASVANRLKGPGWIGRPYRVGLPGSDPSTESDPFPGAYEGATFTWWLRDGPTLAPPARGRVDAFVRVERDGLVLGAYRRFKLAPPVPLEPRAIFVERSWVVREDLASRGARDALLARAEAEATARQTNGPLSDVAARAVRDLPANAPPDQALAAARAAIASGQGAPEVQLQEAIAEAADRLSRGQLPEALAAAARAVAVADGSPAVQRTQRRLGARLAHARALVALAAASGTTRGAQFLADARDALAPLLTDPGPCVVPVAAVERAKVDLADAERLPRGQRPAARTDIITELTGRLAGLPGGTAYQDGPVDVTELPAFLADVYGAEVAFAEDLSRGGVRERVHLSVVGTDGRGYRTICEQGAVSAYEWIPGTGCLLAGNHVLPGDVARPLVMDRTGVTLFELPGITPVGSAEWRGIRIHAGQGRVVARSGGPEYLVQDLTAPASQPRPLADGGGGPDTRSAGVKFSGDGQFASWWIEGRGLVSAPADAFLEGTANPVTVWDATAQPVADVVRTCWTTGAGGQPLVVAWADPNHRNQPWQGTLKVVDPAGGAVLGSTAPFPAGFFPLRAAGYALAGQPRLRLIGDVDPAPDQWTDLPLPASAGLAPPPPAPLAGGPFWHDRSLAPSPFTGLAARDGLLFFGGPPGTSLWRWNAAAPGDVPASLLLPVPGPPWEHRIRFPVVD